MTCLLRLSSAVFLAGLPACLLPPASMGLRSAGDVAGAGTVTAGGGAALVSDGLSGGAADVEALAPVALETGQVTAGVQGDVDVVVRPAE